VVKPTVQFRADSADRRGGAKETLRTTEPKLSPLAGFEAAVVRPLRRNAEGGVRVGAPAGLVTPVITTEIALRVSTATGVAIVDCTRGRSRIAVTVVPFSL